ncbi:UDP-glucoronosyl and UDP-glucosyl transferase [Dionaea muscipula]
MTHPLHFLLFPLMAQGHMIPMIDMAKLIAKQGASVTIVTTPANALRFKPSISRATDQYGLNIKILELMFPSKAAGLPEGCENLDMLPSLSLAMNFMVAIGMLKEQLEQRLQEMNPQPDCIISDMGFPWTTELARKFSIPRIIFHGTCCFSLLCSLNLYKSKILDTIGSDSERFLLPGLPDRIEVTRAQLPNSRNSSSSDRKELTQKIRAAEEESFGVAVNSFEELEPEYVKRYREAKENKVWCLGPVSLCNKDGIDKGDRGNKAAIDENQCLKWLDSFANGSVVYACLGSLNSLVSSQLVELGLGLEASNRPFIWVLREGANVEELEKWMKENGFENRVEGRGLIIRGWAPQVLILSHPATGAFLTHCGWNSIIEAVSAGLPMVTWPMFYEQFLNEKLVVQVLRIGAAVGVEVPVKWGEEDKAGVLVKKEDVRKAVEIVMEDNGEEGKIMKRRARELGKMAGEAIEGGSSEMNLKSLIQEIGKQKLIKGRQA